ncbi:hypothetical protein E5CHR_04490 [Variovorax sp. PBL-E5]|nr:hypothetical protein E5CHR_04490 [Variovorax sp. PBL-E5]
MPKNLEQRNDILDIIGALLATHRALTTVRDALPIEIQSQMMRDMSVVLTRCEALLKRLDETDKVAS